MIVLGILLSVAIVAGLAKRVAWVAEHRAQSHLGFVSHQWLAHYRVSQVSDPQR